MEKREIFPTEDFPRVYIPVSRRPGAEWPFLPAAPAAPRRWVQLSDPLPHTAWEGKAVTSWWRSLAPRGLTKWGRSTSRMVSCGWHVPPHGIQCDEGGTHLVLFFPPHPSDLYKPKSRTFSKTPAQYSNCHGHHKSVSAWNGVGLLNGILERKRSLGNTAVSSRMC